MKLLKGNKVTAVLFLEIVITAIFILKCFGDCAEYTLDSSNFNKSFDGDLMYFDDGSVGIEAQELGELEIMNCPLKLRSGAYSIKVIYSSANRTDITSIDNCVGKVVLGTDNSKILRTSEIQLRDGLNEMQSRFWIRLGNGENEVRVCVRYYGSGKLSIKNILIEEKREYRIMICLTVLFFIIVCNLFYMCFIRKDNSVSAERRRFVVAGIIGITLFSSMTYFADFLFTNWGHDLYFHLSRIISLAKGLSELQIPHRMQFEMLNGYGYASPLFYGEVFLTLPAILYNFYLPIQTCYQVFVISINLFTSVISYWCFRRMVQDWKKGLLGALIYTLSAYRLTNVMVRSAVGEYTALIFFPLLFYGFWVLYNKRENEKILFKDYILIVFAATGIVNSHILSCEMLLIFIIPFTVIKYKKTFRRNIFGALLKSIVITVMLNIWFIFPFLQSMGMKINIANSDSVLRIEGNNVYLPQVFGIFHTAVGENVWEGAKNEMPLAIGLPFILGICLFVFVYIKKDVWDLSYKEMKGAIYCFFFGLIALFFTSDLCKWDNLLSVNKQIARLAGMVQFPWRYLGIATTFLATMTIFAMYIVEKHVTTNKYSGLILGIVASVVLSEGHFIMEFVNIQDEMRIYSESDIGTMVVMGGEYLLQGSDIEDCKQRNIVIGEGIEHAEFSYDKNGQYYLTCSNLDNNVSYVDVPVWYYDNYHAYKSDGEELFIQLGENNRIRVCIPGNYNGTISLKYKVPFIWRVCEMISCITASVIVVVLVQDNLKRRKEQDEISNSGIS